jgi:putative ABC transport system permease protein
VSIHFSSFAALAILFACLGLLGLPIFSAEGKIKEIGLSKVIGASVGSVVLLLWRNIMKLIGIAFLIASPVAWFLIQRWLDQFVSKIEVSTLTFIFPGLLTLFISLFTIGIECFKKAVATPLDSLKYE